MLILWTFQGVVVWYLHVFAKNIHLYICSHRCASKPSKSSFWHFEKALEMHLLEKKTLNRQISFGGTNSISWGWILAQVQKACELLNGVAPQSLYQIQLSTHLVGQKKMLLLMQFFPEIWNKSHQKTGNHMLNPSILLHENLTNAWLSHRFAIWRFHVTSWGLGKETSSHRKPQNFLGVGVQSADDEMNETTKLYTKRWVFWKVQNQRVGNKKSYRKMIKKRVYSFFERFKAADVNKNPYPPQVKLKWNWHGFSCFSSFLSSWFSNRKTDKFRAPCSVPGSFTKGGGGHPFAAP